VALFSGCRGGGEKRLDGVYVTALLVLTAPAVFALIALCVSRLVLALALRRRLSHVNSDAVSMSLRDIMLKSFVWFSLFSFPILATSTLNYFNCRDLGFVGSFLRNDYSIQCDGNKNYSAFLPVAVANTLLYPLGMPIFFYCLIRARKERWATVASTPLHANFNRSWAYFEVFELFRKLLLTSVVGFVLPGSASQCLYLFIVDIIALLVLSVCRPYNSDSDDSLSGALISVECIIFLIAFLLVSDVYEVDNYDKASMMNTVLSLLVISLCVFVPLNVIAKIPSLDGKLRDMMHRFNFLVSSTGIRLPSLNFLKSLDARSRYVLETEEIRESMAEFRKSLGSEVDRGGRGRGMGSVGGMGGGMGEDMVELSNPLGKPLNNPTTSTTTTTTTTATATATPLSNRDSLPSTRPSFKGEKDSDDNML
jgi:hypothetical protein